MNHSHTRSTQKQGDHAHRCRPQERTCWTSRYGYCEHTRAGCGAVCRILRPGSALGRERGVSFFLPEMMIVLLPVPLVLTFFAGCRVLLVGHDQNRRL